MTSFRIATAADVDLAAQRIACDRPVGKTSVRNVNAGP